MEEIEIPSSMRDSEEIRRFATALKVLDDYRRKDDPGFKISARGWAYDLEPYGLRKGEFDRLERMINLMRKRGFLPLDFTAQDPGRRWEGIEIPTSDTPVEWMAGFLRAARNAWDTFTPDWWDGEEFYIQVLVEKIDLKTLFSPICRRFHIPISTSKGWGDINQRAEMIGRFQAAEEKGLKCVLLYCGDFDPFGVKISETLWKNLEDLSGATGWHPPANLVNRFGLNLGFIARNNLSWILNLETGSGKDLADPSHPQNHLPEIQKWLNTIGDQKVEANAIVREPEAGRRLLLTNLVRYLGDDALERFRAKTAKIREEIESFDEDVGIFERIDEALDLIEKED